MMYQNISDYKKSALFYKEGITLAEKLNYKPLLAQAYNGFGNLFGLQKQMTQAAEYFKKAFPAFLKIISTMDLSDIVFFIQLHPAAKEKNLEASLINSLPHLLLSDFSSDEAQIIADCAFYYQTSMCAQFALSGIPVVQIGHEPYLDLLVKNGLCPSIVNEEQLSYVILKKTYNVPIPKDVVLNALGVRDNWLDVLKRL